MNQLLGAGLVFLALVLPPGGSFLDDDFLGGEPAIEALATTGITSGCEPGRFCPLEAVTRGEMATFLGRALKSPLSIAMPAFVDLDPEAFYTPYVAALADAGIFTGVGEGRFAPMRSVTRAEMAALLTRAFQLPAGGPAQFVDVASSDWFAPSVDSLKEAGLTSGCSNDRFCPHDPVTREQLAIFLSRALQLELPTVPARVSPLDGMPVSGLATTRRVIGVKIDNAAPARPQSGIERADAVIELMVEGGLSRMMALFLESDVDYLGPVRSVRPTDALIESLGATIGISGGQPWIADALAIEGIDFIRESQVRSPIMVRISSRSAPHNLYTNTRELRAEATRRGYSDTPPPNLFRWGDFAYATAPAATSIDVSWSDPNSTVWTWDGNRYLRSQGSTAHLWLDQAGNSGRMVADNLIVVFGRYYEVPAPTGTGRVPAMRTIGSGRAVLFTEGRVIDGTWSRPDNETWFTFKAADGTEMVVPPGLSWIHVIPHDRPLSWS